MILRAGGSKVRVNGNEAERNSPVGPRWVAFHHTRLPQQPLPPIVFPKNSRKFVASPLAWMRTPLLIEREREGGDSWTSTPEPEAVRATVQAAPTSSFSLSLALKPRITLKVASTGSGRSNHGEFRSFLV